MKILYAIQATGNGHISRARELLPLLSKYGRIDTFLSGNNAALDPGFEVRYRSRGISLYYNKTGGLDYSRVICGAAPWRIIREAVQLPISQYDIVICDYECISALACRLRNKPLLHFGHQASYLSEKVPRPEKRDPVGEFILKNYAPATSSIGLHFWPYDKDIYTPVISDTIIKSQPTDLGYVTVYLNQFSARNLYRIFSAYPKIQFEIFTGDTDKETRMDNIRFLPIDGRRFATSMINSRGVITGAGFETPAEAMYLGKKLMVVPIRAQYEQLCNAASLKEWNVIVCKNPTDVSTAEMYEWYENKGQKSYSLLYSNEEIVNRAMSAALAF